MMKKLAFINFFVTVSLILLGLIVVMSASSTYSVFKFESAFHLFNSHLFKVGVGIVFLILFCFVPYDIYKKISKPAILTAVSVLILTLIIATDIKGGRRWLNLGLMSVQPADFAKLVLIIHLAYLLEDKNDLLESYRHGFLYMIIWVVIISFLIMVQPNISTGVLVVVISLTLMYVGGAKFKHILASVGSFILAGGALAMLFNHSRERIFAFVNSVQSGASMNIQVKQALYSLGSGGIAGVGIGNSMQNNLFLPEAYGDFIFAILGEELGFIGSILVLLAFMVLFISGIIIAKKTKDRFGQLLAFGISFSIISYAFVNVGVTTGLLPTTGLPLPFISYGGTSILFLCISIGILINIALSNQRKVFVENGINKEMVNEFTKL